MGTISTTPWQITKPFSLDNIQHLETIFTLANGYIGLRATPGFSSQTGKYGCYIAGAFNETPFFGAELANLPMPLDYQIKIDGKVLDLEKADTCTGTYTLNMDEGTLVMEFNIKHNNKKTQLIEKRFLHYKYKQLLAQTVTLTPINYSATATITQKIDIANATTHVLGKDIKHLRIDTTKADSKSILMTYKTSQSNIRLAQQSALVITSKHEAKTAVKETNSKIEKSFTVKLKQASKCTFNMFTAISNSSDTKGINSEAKELITLALDKGIGNLFKEHKTALTKLWKASDVVISGDDYAQAIARFNIFNLINLSPYKPSLSIGAKGLHGEGYRGHAFWDTEIYLLPFYTFTQPTASEYLLRYRLDRLPAAKKYAKSLGYKGARFPWESADTGFDVTPKEGDTSKQEHIIADIVYAVNAFIEANGKKQLMKQYAPIVIECARYYTARVTWDEQKEAYVINDSIGPDEFHQGVDNNFYTNYMVMKTFLSASELTTNKKEKELFLKYAEKMYLPFSKEKGFHEQFNGYFERKDMAMEIDKDGNRILSDYLMSIYNSPKAVTEFGATKLLKQADVVMLYSLFYDDFDESVIKKAYDYYEPKTTHGSSLSRAPYAIIASRLNKKAPAYRDFIRSAELDLVDTKNAAGIHAASLGGAWQILVFGFGGINIKDSMLYIKPNLPAKWNTLEFTFNYLGCAIEYKLTKDTLSLINKGNKTITISMNGKKQTLNKKLSIKL